MTDKQTQRTAASGNTQKDPEDWVTGDEPMTGAQRSYLKTLSEEAKAPFDESLTKAQASQRIDELQHTTGRGLDKTADGSSSAGEEDPDASLGGPADPPPARPAAAHIRNENVDRAAEPKGSSPNNARRDDGGTADAV